MAARGAITRRRRLGAGERITRRRLTNEDRRVAIGRSDAVTRRLFAVPLSTCTAHTIVLPSFCVVSFTGASDVIVIDGAIRNDATSCGVGATFATTSAGVTRAPTFAIAVILPETSALI